MYKKLKGIIVSVKMLYKFLIYTKKRVKEVNENLKIYFIIGKIENKSLDKT